MLFSSLINWLSFKFIGFCLLILLAFCCSQMAHKVCRHDFSMKTKPSQNPTKNIGTNWPKHQAKSVNLVEILPEQGNRKRNCMLLNWLLQKFVSETLSVVYELRGWYIRLKDALEEKYLLIWTVFWDIWVWVWLLSLSLSTID